MYDPDPNKAMLRFSKKDVHTPPFVNASSFLPHLAVFSCENQKSHKFSIRTFHEKSDAISYSLHGLFDEDAASRIQSLQNALEHVKNVIPIHPAIPIIPTFIGKQIKLSDCEWNYFINLQEQQIHEEIIGFQSRKSTLITKLAKATALEQPQKGDNDGKISHKAIRKKKDLARDTQDAMIEPTSSKLSSSLLKRPTWRHAAGIMAFRWKLHQSMNSAHVDWQCINCLYLNFGDDKICFSCKKAQQISL
jgi:hypothetical protein